MARKTKAKAKTKTKTKAKAKAKTKTKAKAKTTKTVKKAVKAAPKPLTMKVQPTDRPRTKSQILNFIAEDCGIARKDVANVFSSLEKTIKADMGTRGPKTFTVPNLMKITVKRKPATKARKGVNPFTGEEMMFKAKPARNTVKVRPLKKLKEMV